MIGDPLCSADWVVEALPALIYAGVVSPDGIAPWVSLYRSTGSHGFIGWTSEAWAEESKSWPSIIHPDDRDELLALVARASGTDGPFRARYRMRAADGSYRWVDERASVESTPDGLLWRGLLLDVTDREEVEARALDAERRLGAIVETVAAGAIIVRDDGRVLWANARMRDLCGIELVGETNLALAARMGFLGLDGAPLEPPDWPTSRTARTGTRIDGMILGLRRADARIIQVQVSSVPIKLPDEVRACALATYIDVTPLHDAAAKALASDEIHGSVLASLAEGVVVYRSTGEVIIANSAGERLIGTRAAAHVANDWHVRAIAGARARARSIVERVFATGAGAHDELLAFPTIEGGLRWVSANAEPVWWPDHEAPWAVVVSFADVTEREQATERLRFHADVLDQVGDAVIAFDLLGRITAWNAAAARLAGVSADDAKGRRLAEILTLDAEQGLDLDAVSAAISETGGASGPAQARRADGHEVELEISATIQRGADGRAVGTLAVMRDVTDRRRLEAQYIQSQKTEALGRMASGVAHDVNNALAVINGYGAVLARRLAKAGDERAARDVEQILLAAQSAAGVTARLLAFARPTEGKVECFDPARDIADSVLLLERLVGEGVAIVATPNSSWPVSMPRDHVQQVLFNLAANARDAMGGRGQLQVTSEDVSLAHPLDHGHGVVPAGDWVRIDVADSGCGMDEQILASLFEPFFTTKGIGAGTGLGLTISQDLVARAGGALSVQSEPGTGSMFSIWLPAAREAVPNNLHLRGGPAPRPASSRARILLVEDDADLRALVERILADEGYELFVAGSGEEALEVTQGLDVPVDLLLSDVVLPGMAGPQVADALRERWPRLPVLYISGYTGELLTKRDLRIPGASLLTKPFTPTLLAARVQRAIDERAQADPASGGPAG